MLLVVPETEEPTEEVQRKLPLTKSVRNLKRNPTHILRLVLQLTKYL